MTWSPSNPPAADTDTASSLTASLDAALTAYANTIQAETGLSFLGIVWPAYQTLHCAVRLKVNDGFTVLQGTESAYANSFTKAVWSKNPLFRTLNKLLTDGGDAFNTLGLEYLQQMELDTALLQNTGSALLAALSSVAADAVTDSYNFFANASIFDQLAVQLTQYISDTAELLQTALAQTALDQTGTATSATAITPLQEAALYLLFVPFGLQAIFSALSAKDLYEIDGNVGARAAAVKLGAAITGESQRASPDPDLLALQSTVGGIAQYVSAVWSILGATLPGTISNPLDLSQASTLADVTNFSQLLIYAELGDGVALPDTQKGFKPDGLGAWKAPRNYPDPQQPGTNFNTAKVELAVPAHVLNASATLASTGQGASIALLPTWLALLDSPGTLGYLLSKNANALYVHSLAHLGLFVAARLFARSLPYIGVPLPPVGGGQVSQEPPLPSIIISAACLEFGGRHHPHKTHRSGYEMDLTIHNGQVRKLDDLAPPAGASGKVIQAILNGGSNIAPDHFDPQQYDWYGKNAAKDTPRSVAIARSLELSLYLSGCSRVIFNDPWLFLDVFSFLRKGLASWKQLVKTANQTPPSHFGDDSTYLAPVHLALVKGHNTHWHVEWAIPHDNAGLICLNTDFLRKWVPVWSALEISRDELISVLADLLAKSNPSDATKQIVQTMVKQITQFHVSGLPSLYHSMYENAQGQNWLSTMPIHGNPS